MYDELVKSLRQCAEASCAGCKNDLVQIGCRGLLQHEAADAIEHMQKTILRLENELGVYDDLPMVDQSMVLSKTEKTTEPPKEEHFGKTEQLKQEYYHAFCSRCGRPVIAKKEDAFWWPGGTTDDHLCIRCDVCDGLAEV